MLRWMCRLVNKQQTKEGVELHRAWVAGREGPSCIEQQQQQCFYLEEWRTNPGRICHECWSQQLYIQRPGLCG